MTTLKAKTPADIAAFACVALGFVPTESVIVTAPGTGFTARVDLMAGHAEEAVGSVVPYLATHGKGTCIAVLVTTNHECVDEHLEALRAATAWNDIELVEVIHVDEEVVTSLVAFPGQKENVDLRTHPFVLQVNVNNGRQVSASRDSLADELQPRNVLDLALIPEPSPPADTEAMAGIYAGLDAAYESGNLLDDATLALLYANVGVGDTRDRINFWLARTINEWRTTDTERLSGGGGKILNALADATARAPQHLNARSLTAALCAQAAHMVGDGARAWVAIDVARATWEGTGHNSLADLVSEMLSSAFPPDQVLSLWLSVIPADD
jgi:hypothetical protein